MVGMTLLDCCTVWSSGCSLLEWKGSSWKEESRLWRW